MHSNVKIFLSCILFISIGVSACQLKDDTAYTSPAGYDLKKPHIIKLPLELDEISGLAFYPKDTSIFAINDEVGWLYKIYPKRPGQINKWKFYAGSDYEDLVIHDSLFYVLQSNGNILTFKFSSGDSVFVKQNVFPQGSGNEFEILYYDDSVHQLVLMCKDCETDKKKSLSTYYFNPETYSYNASSFEVNVSNIAASVGKKKIKFKPSAASINPLTGDLFIISAINQLLVVADKRGNIKEVYNLNKKYFKQPEGLTFTPSGDLLISNEAGDAGVADILIFPYNKRLKK